MELTDLAGAAAAEIAALRESLDPLHTLGDVLDWARRLDPPVPSPAVVTQDEYTHDVLVPYAGGRWLAFDTT